MKLYLYCLIDDDASVERLIYSGENEGISGSPVTLFSIDDFNLLVSNFAGGTVPVTRENVLKHAAIVNSVLPETTPLPFRFGTLAAEPELRSFLTSRSETLRARQALVRDCVEMSVKIIWDREWNDVPAPMVSREERPGTAFLAEKRRELLGGEARTVEARKIANWLEIRLGAVVREQQVKTNSTDKLLVSAAHLVARDLVDQYRATLKSAEVERPELHFLVSGPWPPYSFANIDLEFKTQFGVS